MPIDETERGCPKKASENAEGSRPEPSESAARGAEPSRAQISGLVDHLFRSEYGRLVAVLTRAFGLKNLAVAEDLVQETLAAAMQSWAQSGVPRKPEAWLMQVAKNKALNLLKSERRHGELQATLDRPRASEPEAVFLRSDIEDAQLQMIFACCHPELLASDQVALVLKTLCGFGVGEVAQALLLTTETVSKRLYRAKLDIKRRNIALEVPGGALLEPRLSGVCTCLYLLFNEGYYSSRSEQAIRKDLCTEAMRLCRLLTQRFEGQPQVFALMSLMCLHAARFNGRMDADGRLVPFEEQRRELWDQELIAIGLNHLFTSARGAELSSYHLEASIAARHCAAESLGATDWRGIRELYQELYRLNPNPLLQLNLAIVTSRIEGADAALRELSTLEHDARLARDPLFYATHGELLLSVGQARQAEEQFRIALGLAGSAHQHEHFKEKIRRVAVDEAALLTNDER